MGGLCLGLLESRDVKRISFSNFGLILASLRLNGLAQKIFDLKDRKNYEPNPNEFWAKLSINELQVKLQNFILKF